MKIFIYKTLIISFLIFILFHLTIGYTIRSLETRFFNTFSKEKINYVKDKIREEIKNSISKERILEEEDAKNLGKFIDKIINEIRSEKR
tara:strand:+ start:66 stop:332 length:267 start_codon:yes stop_codon:yes gene_type:complete